MRLGQILSSTSHRNVTVGHTMQMAFAPQLLLATFVVLVLVATPGECIIDPNIPNFFYPFGPDQGDTVGPIADDGFTASITIPGGFPFFGSGTRLLYVSIL